MKRTMKAAVSLIVGLGVLGTTAGSARAETPQERREHWRQTHPARAKDNARIRNQRRLLRQDLKSGKITKEQYQAQMKDLNTIKKEEVVDARANENGGHLTAGQQQAINSQLNESRKDINQDVNAGQNTH